MMFRPAMIVAVAASLLLLGCGSDDDTDTAPVSSSGDPTETAPAGDGGTNETVGAEIEIADFAFVGDQQVAVGGTVLVTNTDAASHTWTSVDGSFDSGTLAEGESFEFTFDEPGTFRYRCDIHETMAGSIEVTG